MAEKNGVDQKELKKLLKSMKKLPVNVQKNVVNGSTRAAATVVKKEMITRVPYETGTLEEAINIKKAKSPKNISKYNVGIKKIVMRNGKGAKDTRQYAYYLEYGTKKMAAQSFIRPSLHAVGNKPLEAAKKYFEPRMKKEAKKLGFKI